ncbi:MAG: hypothetical protein WCI72_05970 [archaeon]
MGWKDRVNWEECSYQTKGALTGGFISLLLLIIYSLLYFFIFETNIIQFEPLESFLEILFLFLGPLFGGVTLLVLFIPGTHDLIISNEHRLLLGVEFTPVGILINIISWIILGILIGWKIEKNKNRRNQQ